MLVVKAGRKKNHSMILRSATQSQEKMQYNVSLALSYPLCFSSSSYQSIYLCLAGIHLPKPPKSAKDGGLTRSESADTSMASAVAQLALASGGMKARSNNIQKKRKKITYVACRVSKHKWHKQLMFPILLCNRLRDDDDDDDEDEDDDSETEGDNTANTTNEEEESEDDSEDDTLRAARKPKGKGRSKVKGKDKTNVPSNSSWTLSEDQLVILMHAKLSDTQKKWTQIANYVDGRTENAIKQRWNVHIKKRIADGASSYLCLVFMPCRFLIRNL